MINNDIYISKDNLILPIKSSKKLDTYEIIIYLPTPSSSYYQLYQWLKPLKEINKNISIAVLTRNTFTFNLLAQEIEFPTIYIQRMKTLRSYYKNNSPKLTFYVNNSLNNNQSLLNRKSFHIHINHGESEKECMSSNQSKAYDYVFTVGQRGIDRYKEYLLNFDSTKYLKIGRPQLDFINPLKIEGTEKKILYAPTWEAHFSEMNYCSLEQYGIKIAKEIIKNPKYIFIYKPHPLIGTQKKSVRKIHNQIVGLIKNATNAFYYRDPNIIDLFDSIDFALFDNSSVMIDYLLFDKPGAYIEVRKDIKSTEIIKAFYKISEKEIGNKLASIINDFMISDKFKDTRRLTKKHYLGEYKKGEPTSKFVNTINNLIEERDKQVNNLKDRISI